MKNKKFLSCIISVPIVLSLCNCSSFTPDAGSDDRMIGVFITTEFLDLFHIEQYVNDHASALKDGQEVSLPSGTKYEGKLYAEIDKSKGDDPIDWELSFGNLDGINLFTPLWTPGNGEAYWGAVCSEGISDTNISYSESEDAEEHHISGTVYILPEKASEDTVYYANPVYQTASGDIYVTRGQGVAKSGAASEGESLLSTFSGEATVMEDGKRKAGKCNVTVQYAYMYRPVQITICQMNREHQIVKQDIYKPEEVPEQMTAEPDTEYILVEMEKAEASGEKNMCREVYDYNPGKEVCLTTFCAREDGIVIKQETQVLWNR